MMFPPVDVENKKTMLWLVLLGSLVLSLLAFMTDPVLNRDGMLYVDIATRLSQGEGLSQAIEAFNWPFFPILLSAFVHVSPLSPDLTAAIITAAFSAGSCLALALILCRFSPPQRYWLVALLVLALPALNEYRGDVLRDWPAWCFSLFGIWAFLRYCDSHQWRWIAGFFLCITLGTLQRLEVAALAGGLVFSSLFVLWGNHKALARLWLVPIVLAVSVLSLVTIDAEGVGARVMRYLSAINVLERYQAFQVKGNIVADGVLNQFSHEYGAQILFWGLVSIVPAILLSLYGLLSLAFLMSAKPLPKTDSAIFRGTALVWLTVLVLFLAKSFFLSSRYVVPLALLLMPFVFVKLDAFLHSRGRYWQAGVVFLLVASALSSAISTSGHKKAAIRDAGEWLASHPEKRVYINDDQVAFYAGQGYKSAEDRPGMMPPADAVELLALRVDDSLLSESRDWPAGFVLERVFDSGGRDVVVILRSVNRASSKAASGKPDDYL